MMLIIVLCFKNVEAVNLIDRRAGGYVRLHCSDDVASTFESRRRNGIQAIFNVKCKNSRKLVVYDDRALLCFVPDISDELQIVRLLKVAFPVFYSCKNFLVESVMRLAKTSYLPAIVNVHIKVP